MPRPDGALALPSSAVLVLALTLGLAGGVGGAFATSAITGAVAQGSAGAQGSDGSAGAQGSDGSPGAQGDQGEKGQPGTQGDQGEKGQPGTQGERGQPGEKGQPGAPGPAGPIGPGGTVGLPGQQGEAGTAGPIGLPGLAGPAGPVGPAGPIGPAGPAGADGSSVLSYTVLSARQTLAKGTSIVDFTEESSSSTPAGIHAGGMIAIPTSGTYRVTYVAAPSAGIASHISLGRDSSSEYWLSHNGNKVDGSVVARPIFDVNIALILTLRTMVQGGSYSATSYLNAQAGDIVRFVSTASDDIPATDTAITLTIERIS